MSIKVKKLSKVYGTQIALTEVSFEINKGEIVGFGTKWCREIYPYENPN